ncbi:MAG TPA: ATP-binding protein [Planosporangium sp.]|jgi:signal transduction histidine kinase|nr:ATP-binding protein [Planosporangium sp.]
MRTTATALAVVGTALVVAAVTLLVLLHRSLEGDADAQARLRLHDVTALARRGELPPTLAGEDDGTVAQVVSHGRVVSQSPIIHGATPLGPSVPAGAEVVARTVEHPPIGDGGAYRVVAQLVDTPTGPAMAYAAASLEPVADSMHELRILLAAVVPVLIVLVGATTWTLVGRTLEPVEAIRRQVAEISATALDRRVPEPATADEVGRLARTMNDMLDRLDVAARRQRTFVADASHELRSPLAVIRTKLEVALARPAGVDWPGLAGEWLDEQGRLARLVDDLLLLARLDEGVPVVAPTTVDLDELVLREAADLRARGQVHVDVSRVAGGRVRGDAQRLRRVVDNLLDNAERHAAGTVTIELGQRDGVVEFAVCDDGPGIPLVSRQRVFERFVRLDESRARGSGGAGLGLAIVRDIVAGHGGTAEAVDTAFGARMVVRLPAAEASNSG